jgi:hypothetical protein
MRHRIVLATLAATLAWSAIPDAATSVTVPLVCSRGSSGQHHDARVTVPKSADTATKYTIRIDGVSSGRISNTGLNYLHDMSTDYLVPAGTRYVDGSVHVVANTGTENVRAGARAYHDSGIIRLQLPAHVENGSSFTPPSIEFDVEVASNAGASLPLAFAQYRVAANAFLVGDVHVTCDPTPKPFTLAKTSVTSPAPLDAGAPSP